MKLSDVVTPHQLQNQLAHLSTQVKIDSITIEVTMFVFTLLILVNLWTRR